MTSWQCNYKILALLILFTSLLLNSCDILDSHQDSKPVYYTSYRIAIADLENKTIKVIADGSNIKFIPGKNRIVYWGNSGGLHAINTDGSGASHLYEGDKSIWDYSLSQDGNKIALVLYKAGSSVIYLMNIDGSDLKQLTFLSGSFDIYPSIAPLNDKITFRRNFNLFIMNIDGTDQHIIKSRVDSTRYFGDIHFLDNNNIFCSENFQSSDSIKLHILNLDGNDIYEKTIYKSYILDVSQDKKILIRSEYPSTLEVLDLNDSSYAITPIAEGLNGTFSFDGRQIAYSDFNKNIYLANTDGSNKELIYHEADTTKWINVTRISPDKRYIAFDLDSSYVVR